MHPGEHFCIPIYVLYHNRRKIAIRSTQPIPELVQESDGSVWSI